MKRELVASSWPYRDLAYDDFIEVLDMLHEERRIWVDWEENIYTKRGFSQMIITRISEQLPLTIITLFSLKMVF